MRDHGLGLRPRILSLPFDGFGDDYRDFLLVFACTLALSILTYLQELTSFSFVFDDYIQLRGNTASWSENGRWMADLLYNLVLQSSISPTLWLLLGLAILSATATLIVFVIGHSEVISSTFAAYIIVGTPYVHEIMHYNSQSLLYPMAVSLATFAIVAVQPKFASIFAASITFAMAIGIYQVAIGYFLTIAVCLFLARVSNSQPSPLPLRSFRLVDWTLAAALATATGLTIYWLVTEAYFLATDAPRNVRMSLNFDLSHIIEGIVGSHAIHARTLSSLLEASGGYADVSRYLLMSFLLGAVVVSSWVALRSKGVMNFGFVVMLWGVLIAAPLSYTLPLTSSLGKPRLLGPFGVVLGFAVLLSFRMASRYVRVVMVAAVVVLIVAMVIRSNRLQFENQMQNIEDFALSVRILSRIESDPDFDPQKRYALILIGKSPRNPDWGVLGKHGIYGSIGGSAFYADWSKRHIFLYQGFNFRRPTPEQRALAEDYAERSRPWPDDSAVEVTGDVIIVVLPNA